MTTVTPVGNEVGEQWPPDWDGSPLAGRRILLRPTGGLGDCIEQLRFVPLLAAQGGRVILVVRPELVRLAGGVTGSTEIHSSEAPLPAADVVAVPGQGPYIMQRINWGPVLGAYIKAPMFGAVQLAPGPITCGIVWAGSPTHSGDRHRSAPLQPFLRLFRSTPYRWVSLQVGARARDMGGIADGERIIDRSSDLRDFADTAHLLAQLDLLVSVDTSTAHCAGAIGLRTFLLLGWQHDTRWQKTDYPAHLYPSVRCFRVPEPGEWEAVADLVLRELTRLGRPRPLARQTCLPGMIPPTS